MFGFKRSFKAACIVILAACSFGALANSSTEAKGEFVDLVDSAELKTWRPTCNGKDCSKGIGI